MGGKGMCILNTISTWSGGEGNRSMEVDSRKISWVVLEACRADQQMPGSRAVLWKVSQSASCSVMSNFLWLHGMKPTRLLCPWDSPSKNTGVCSHPLLQGIFPTQGSNQVSCIAGRFFTVWATREGQITIIKHRQVSAKIKTNLIMGYKASQILLSPVFKNISCSSPWRASRRNEFPYFSKIIQTDGMTQPRAASLVSVYVCWHWTMSKR